MQIRSAVAGENRKNDLCTSKALVEDIGNRENKKEVKIGRGPGGVLTVLKKSNAIRMTITLQIS